jgi:hypothetical protein
MVDYLIEPNIQLQLAVDDRNIDEINKLLNSHDYLDLRYPIIQAAKLGHDKILTNLLKHKLNCVEYSYIDCALEYICKNNDLECLKVIYDHYKINNRYLSPEIYGVSGDACKYNAKSIIDYSIANKLFNYHAGINGAIQGNNIDLMEYLINKGPEGDKNFTEWIFEYLDTACSCNNRKIIKYLLRKLLDEYDEQAYIDPEDCSKEYFILIMDCLYEITTLKRHHEILNDHEMCDIVEKGTNRDVANNVLKYLISI